MRTPASDGIKRKPQRLNQLVVSGCAAGHTSVANRKLDVQTRRSAAVFLDPVGPDKKTVFIQVRNTSDKPSFDLEGPIRNAIRARGYQVLDDPEAAHFKLQAHHVSAMLPSWANAGSRPSTLGGDFVLYPNLSCRAPWVRNLLPTAAEWSFEEDESGGWEGKEVTGTFSN